MNESIIFEKDPKEIKIAEDLPRYRKEIPKLKELLASIERFGQLVPIVITKDNVLVAGGRRLAACLLGNIKVKCIYKDTASPLQMREIELEENLQREDLSPAEEAEAIADLHRIRQKLYGEAQSGRKGGWRLKDTAASIGKTPGTVVEAIKITEILKDFPELRTLPTKKAIKKAVRGAEAVVTKLANLEKAQEVLEKQESCDICQKDAVEYLKSIEDNSIDIIITDPPYGIDIDKIQKQIEGKPGGQSLTGHKFSDDPEASLSLYKILAKESFRISKPTSHAWIFVCPEHFSTIRKFFVDNNWDAHIRPIIWIKRTIGQCNVPKNWPSACYEMILYCRRVDSVIIEQGKPDWIQCDPVLSDKRLHPTEKPVPLIKELLKRVAYPGQVLLDPFLGSGAIIEAGLQHNLICKGCEIDKAIYATAADRLSKVKSEAN